MTYKKFILYLGIFLVIGFNSWSQVIPIQNIGVNASGQAEIEVNAKSTHYYILKVRKDTFSVYDVVSSMTLGKDGKLTITEQLAPYPHYHYKVEEYSKKNPIDIDGDGINDLTEYNNKPSQNPINAAQSVNTDDGVILLSTFNEFKRLSVRKDIVPFAEHLNGLGFLKFIITDFYTRDPKVYFINTNKHSLHKDFADAIGVDHLATSTKKGEIVYLPLSISSNGTIGTYAFNYSGGYGDNFSTVQRTHELLAANMPLIQNNLSYFVTTESEDEYARDSALYKEISRIPILLEKDIYGDVDYWGLNRTEGFGFFRKMSLDEIPGTKDIVLYDAIPNALPRVSGIITSVLQTPLSHVNLRAIQDKIPNAFIRDPLAIDSVADLLGKYIYFKVEQNSYTIREASLQEVNEWFDNIRPHEAQDPPLNLCYETILPLNKIGFKMFDGYGAKCANVATMRKFNFNAGTIPDGYGIPFYYYQEFMKHNDFFSEVERIINEPSFKKDRLVRDSVLNIFRKKIRNASMPSWMLVALDDMHRKFPPGTAVRCRSSTNNEDLPGFNGAGLYTSKTQHLHEGHISKSIKQVYASLWNLRAFEERDFYRVNHFKTSMGVLCHPNFNNELSNGVGVSTDPLYNTENTYYLNTQIGEELITNPDSNAQPEEILLDRDPVSSNSYVIIQRSNLVPNDSALLTNSQLDQLRDYLRIIHDEFQQLYHAESNPYFAMDIEYKITKDNQLAIKQARPWVSYILNSDQISTRSNVFNLISFPNPATNCIVVECPDCNLAGIRIADLNGRVLKTKRLTISEANHTHIELNDLPPGMYILSAFLENNKLVGTTKFIKR